MYKSNDDSSRVVNGIGELFIYLLKLSRSCALHYGTDGQLFKSIQLILTNKLNESGWTDDLRHRSKGAFWLSHPLLFGYTL
jgi:hypothetical protein